MYSFERTISMWCGRAAASPQEGPVQGQNQGLSNALCRLDLLLPFKCAFGLIFSMWYGRAAASPQVEPVEGQNEGSVNALCLLALCLLGLVSSHK